MMRPFYLFAIFCLFSSYTKTGKDQLVEIQSKIERVLLNADPSSHFGLEVISLKSGQILFQQNQNKLLSPSSTLKLFTGAAALSILGVDYCFETNVSTPAEIKQGKLQGDLYLKGSGDPSLAVNDLKNLVFQLKLQQVQTIEGDLIIDHSEFDNIPLGPGWMWDEGSELSNSPMDALTVNHSSIDIWVRPSDKRLQPPSVVIYPDTPYVVVHNQALTEEKGGSLQVTRRWMTKENVIEIEGKIAINTPLQHYRISLDEPSLYAGHLFKQFLQDQGIRFKGQVIHGLVPQTAKILASHCSQPLSLLVKTMIKNSDNLYASCIFKKLGVKRLGVPGTWAKGAQTVRQFLSKEAGIDIGNLVFLDGSGDSRYNLVSAHQMVQFLIWAHKQFAFAPEFLASLPISGTDGTLANRMTAPGVKGKIRAKTGGMPGVSALAGYAATQDGEVLVFSMFTEGFIRPSSAFKGQLEDELCNVLTSYSRD